MKQRNRHVSCFLGLPVACAILVIISTYLILLHYFKLIAKNNSILRDWLVYKAVTSQIGLLAVSDQSADVYSVMTSSISIYYISSDINKSFKISFWQWIFLHHLKTVCTILYFLKNLWLKIVFVPKGYFLFREICIFLAKPLIWKLFQFCNSFKEKTYSISFLKTASLKKLCLFPSR